ELLRFIPGGAAGGLMRVATEDVEVGGTLIRAGDGVIAVTNSANRDDEVWADPDRFDITRAPGPHTSFGHGAHHCVGAQLARIEMQVGLGSLFARFPTLRLAADESELPAQERRHPQPPGPAGERMTTTRKVSSTRLVHRRALPGLRWAVRGARVPGPVERGGRPSDAARRLSPARSRRSAWWTAPVTWFPLADRPERGARVGDQADPGAACRRSDRLGTCSSSGARSPSTSSNYA
ncbi:cytochrome P450, partial [Saccharothrix sp. MB29]|nr:cytochrome P450 [Saccharothrix sp. MB29]